MADERGESSAVPGDGFGARLKSKAQEIRRIATEERVTELNNDIAAGSLHREGEDSDMPVRTSTTEYIERGSAEWKEIYRNYEWVSTMFDTLSKLPDPAKFTPASQDMDAVKTKLGNPVEHNGLVKFADSAMGGVDVVGTRLSGWEGDAKEAWTTFSSHWAAIVINQAAISGLVKFAAESHGNIYGRARTDAERLADDAKEALLHTGTDIKTVLKILNAVAEAASVVVPLSKVATLSLQASKLAEDQLRDQPELPLGAHCVNEVLKNLFDAIAELTGRIMDEELLLRKVLNADLNAIAEARKYGILVPRELGEVTDLRRGHLSGMSPV